jgi:hypothetical protein
MVVVASRLNVADSKFRSQILIGSAKEGIESSAAGKDTQRMKQVLSQNSESTVLLS